MLGLAAVLVVNRLGDYFDQQQRDELAARSLGVAQYVVLVAESASSPRQVIDASGLVDPAVISVLERTTQQRIVADRLAQADVTVRFGRSAAGAFLASPNGTFAMKQQDQGLSGQTREPITSQPFRYDVTSAILPYQIEVTLANPYTFRAAAITNVTGLLAVIGLFAMAVAVVVATALARRFTSPLRRLREASRGLAEGDLARRVPAEAMGARASELGDLAHQFNVMAERLQESVDIIRRDRDRSRDFLADVSHELRTPIAALRTFNELLVEHAGSDPAARAEFLEASKVQLERLDWLAQNLLELSKLDSGLVLLDLRPDDLRATVEQAVEQAEAAAKRRSIDLTVDLPEHPLRIRHDPVRIGQVVANLVGNAIKFTDRGGHVRIEVRPWGDGARIAVTDTGVGIDAAELPRIFERFYRGTRASEARATGSGLGLAIVRSIVDMHAGTVSVESRVGAGTAFTVTLPRDPRTAGSTADATASGSAPGAMGDAASAAGDDVDDDAGATNGRRGPDRRERHDPASRGIVAETSPSISPDVNAGPSR